MSQKGQLQAVLEGKCPKCRKGNMFPYPVYRLTKFHKMNDHCPHCGLRFEVEPGFFYGAMYVSYALSVGIFLTTVFFISLTVQDPSLQLYIGSVVLMALLLYPFNFRYSRILFEHIFGGVKFDPGK